MQETTSYRRHSRMAKFNQTVAVLPTMLCSPGPVPMTGPLTGSCWKQKVSTLLPETVMDGAFY